MAPAMQLANTAGKRRRSAETDGLPKPKTKRGKPKQMPPHLQSRLIYAFLNLLPRLLLMPTKALFHVACIEHVWGDSKWLSYYKTEYMSTRPAHNATAEGCQEFLHGSWWSGLSSRLLPGRPATQQPIEMLNSHYKRAMRSQRSLHSHIAVAMSLEDTVRAWSAPLAPMETDEKKLVSLMCPDDQVSLSRPRDPDRWMGTTGLCRRSPFGRLRFYPPIGPLLKRFKKRNSEYVQEVTTQNKDKTEQKWLLGGLGGYRLG